MSIVGELTEVIIMTVSLLFDWQVIKEESDVAPLTLQHK